MEKSEDGPRGKSRWRRRRRGTAWGRASVRSAEAESQLRPQSLLSPQHRSSDMQLPTAPGSGVELQHAMETLDIARDPRESQAQPQLQPRSQPQLQQPGQVSREPSRATSDHPREGQAGSSQASGKIGGALKASHSEVWYLKSIDFTSPSGITRKYNIITQNYNGSAFHPVSLMHAY